MKREIEREGFRVLGKWVRRGLGFTKCSLLGGESEHFWSIVFDHFRKGKKIN